MKRSTVFICLLLCFALSVGASALNIIEEDFDLAGAGEDLASLDNVYGYFDWNNATNESACDLADDNGSTVLKLSGYSEFFTIDYIPAEYVFSVDIKPVKENGMVNVFVRGDMPGALVKLNPKNAGTMQVFAYYEWDWYAENGGSNGLSSVGGSGISVSLTKSGFNLNVKKYAEDSLTITSDKFRMKTDEAIDLDAYNNVKITDTGKEIRIYINGDLGAYITLSDDSVVYESDGTNIEYYKSASVYSADGTKAGDVENTRLHYKGSQIAIACRNETFYADNIKIACGEHAIEYSNGEYAPETADTSKTTTEATVTNTPDRVTDSVTSDAAKQSDPADTDEVKQSGGMGKKGKIIIGAVAADAVIIAAMAIFIPKKKK